MKKKNVWRKLLVFVTTMAMVLPLTACGGKIQSLSLMEGVKQSRSLAEMEPLSDEERQEPEKAAMDFAVELFKHCLEDENSNGKNVLISPISVMTALAMTANGAKGETLKQMEKVFGTDMATLNQYLALYMAGLPQGKNYKCKGANSIWFSNRGDLTVEQDFLQTNADYYAADMYEAAFDESTRKDINLWVEQKTDGMIPEFLSQLPADTMMYLINAVIFDAKWEHPYKKEALSDGRFVTEDGEDQEAEWMHSTEYAYLEDANATGVMRYYADKKYAFVGLLPNEGVSVAEYVDSLTADGLKRMLEDVEHVKVETIIPKFESDYDIQMKDVLAQMGMEDAFSGQTADFSGIGECTVGPLYIGDVVHKTRIEVGPEGTKAAAVTGVEMNGAAAPAPEEVKEVYLTRPFVYLLIDCETNQPFFIGTVMSVEK